LKNELIYRVCLPQWTLISPNAYYVTDDTYGKVSVKEQLIMMRDCYATSTNIDFSYPRDIICNTTCVDGKIITWWNYPQLGNNLKAVVLGASA
jgi:hypothetical protein